jgi:uncharacterized membrane protein YccC
MDYETQQTVKKLAEAVDQRLGSIIGVAGVLAALPETAKINKADALKAISALCQGVAFAGTSHLSGPANQIANAILAMAQKIEGDRRYNEQKSQKPE